MKILSAKQLYKADQVTIEKGAITSVDLMERAATACFQWIDNRLQGNNIPIHVFCGTGNNGGDGLVIARHLKQHGYNVKTYVINCSNERSKDFLINYERLKELGVWAEMITCTSELPELPEDNMIVDAIFGLGLSRPPENILKEVIKHINKSKAYVLSIDMPSGLYADTAITDKNAIIKAYHILTFQTPKLAFLLPENQEYITSWEVVDIGLDKEFINNIEVNNSIIEKESVLSIYKYREKFSHKGSYGHTLIIGGSFGKIGAVTLASRAALNIGSGLVTAYVPKCGYQILQTAIPEVMVEVDVENEICNFNPQVNASVVGIGVGLGTSVKTAKGFATFLAENKLPLVIDADGINLLAKNKSLLKLLPENTILTPHLKEFERLAGKSKNDYDRLDKLKKIAKKYKLIVILKGAYTAIAHQDRIYFNATGNPALATAGSGDVLTGILAGLVAQNYTAFDACVLGVYLHGKTAELAMDDKVYETFTASDCIEYLSDAYKDLLNKEVLQESKQQVKEGEQDTEETKIHV